ncbi:hypothetical protein [Brevundimonas nasdae]|uniref:Secreted protein n=1 Tax=Brevundimonas nasdae TaxID=172043 RepID=A0ABX8TIB4_9CAUL|nr:hypothetical protein [Brevundimonas nasdae]QYC09808.1 hypothetical protein KWG56_14710 [Brevundimonas nasdae]QYC12597.1 hypothetical protein KWG63_10030 [Brevundimonas nasdae]
MSKRYRIRRVQIAMAAAVAIAAIGIASPSSARGNPETCSYREVRLAQVCRTDSDIRQFLRDPANAGVESYMAIPPVIRGWEPGEEEMVLSLLSGQPQPRPVAAQTSPSRGSIMDRIDRLASGEYDRQVAAERARTPRVNWTATQIRTAARSAVTNRLREPGSAQFRNVRRHVNSLGTTTFCGEVNSQNVYGGMTGFRRFHSSVSDRGEASGRINDEGGLIGTVFEATWERICDGAPGTPTQF